MYACYSVAAGGASAILFSALGAVAPDQPSTMTFLGLGSGLLALVAAWERYAAAQRQNRKADLESAEHERLVEDLRRSLDYTRAELRESRAEIRRLYDKYGIRPRDEP